MKFSIIINKSANFYFFLQNLSEWHSSNRKDYNDFWQKELGEFTPKEKNFLKSFAQLHKRYSLEQDFFGQIFFESKNPFGKLQRKLPEKDFKLLAQIFAVFEPRFDRLYKKELPYLKKWKILLTRYLNRATIIQRLNHALASLYRARPLKKKIVVYVLFSSPDASGGSASSNSKNVTLEISRYSFREVNHAIGLVWHELIHAHFEKYYLFPLLKREFPSHKNRISFIKEVAASSLLPNGILARSIFKTKAKNLHANLPVKYNKPLLKLTEKYIKEDIFFGREYVETLFRLFF